MKLNMFVLLFTVFSIFSCKDAKENSTKTLVSEEHNEYLIVKVEDSDVEKHKLTLNFDVEENKVNGFAGCNHYFGGLKILKENQVEFADIGSTKMMCPETMQIENRFLETLQQTKKYELSAEKLLLKDEEGKLIIEAKMQK